MRWLWLNKNDENFMSIISGCVNRNFTTVWDTTKTSTGSSASNQIKFPTVGGAGSSYNCVVSWGDGTTSTITTFNDAAWTHTYPSPGVYTVVISGIFYGIQFGSANSDRLKLLNILRWGAFRFNQQSSAFAGCANLVISAQDIVDMTGANRMDLYFSGCASLVSIPNFNRWNFLNIISFGSCFLGCSNLNMTINIRVTVNTTIDLMFRDCIKLNSPITIDATSCSSYASFLLGCTIFNSAVVLNSTTVNSISAMFQNCPAFNQSVANLGTFTNVTNASVMFFNAISFNQPINFNLPNCTAMNSFLNGATAFNSSITLTLAAVTLMNSFFFNCVSFNQPISFNTPLCTTFLSFLQGAVAFNNTISLLTNAATTFTSMFNGATLANPDVSLWIIANLTSAATMFTGSAFNITNYNKLLDSVTGWPSQAVRKNNVVFSAGTAHYSVGNPTTGRNILTSVNLWTITDGGSP